MILFVVLFAYVAFLHDALCGIAHVIFVSCSAVRAALVALTAGLLCIELFYGLDFLKPVISAVLLWCIGYFGKFKYHLLLNRCLLLSLLCLWLMESDIILSLQDTGVVALSWRFYLWALLFGAYLGTITGIIHNSVLYFTNTLPQEPKEK